MRLESVPVISLSRMPAHVADSDDDENWKAFARLGRRAEE